MKRLYKKYYYYHPESDSLFERNTKLEESAYNEVDELTREEYITRQRELFKNVPVIDNTIDANFYLWKKGTSVLKILSWFSQELQKYRK